MREQLWQSEEDKKKASTSAIVPRSHGTHVYIISYIVVTRITRRSLVSIHSSDVEPQLLLALGPGI